LTLQFFIICSAPDDIPRADEIRALVKDIWDLRLAKLRRSIDLMVTQQEIFGKV
jgi:GINS complex subunit 2